MRRGRRERRNRVEGAGCGAVVECIQHTTPQRHPMLAISGHRIDRGIDVRIRLVRPVTTRRFESNGLDSKERKSEVAGTSEVLRSLAFSCSRVLAVYPEL